jgi:hypothetical protein
MGESLCDLPTKQYSGVRPPSYSWHGHQPAADFIVAYDGKQLAVEYAELFAQVPSRHK